MLSSALVIRLGGLAGVVAGLGYFVGYAGMAELLLPVMSNLGGHVVLGLAGIATLLALIGVLARDTGRSARLGRWATYCPSSGQRCSPLVTWLRAYLRWSSGSCCSG